MISSIIISAVTYYCTFGTVLGAHAFGFSDKPYSQSVSDSQNLLKYVANHGPYTDRRGVGLDRDPPSGCRVDQAFMLSRHGERFPQPSSWNAQLAAINKIKQAANVSGSLLFAKSWIPFAASDDSWLHQESLVGAYSGLLDAYYHGILARRQYDHLYDPNSKLPLFVSAYQRDVDTGRKFGQGFLQWNYSEMAAVNLIKEHNGANSLSTHCTLINPVTKHTGRKNNSNSNEMKYEQSSCPSFTFYDEFKAAASRLNSEAPGANLQESDIKSLMDVVSYELNVRGSSPWASVFTAEEWVAYEYFVTSQYYCNAGPGSVTAPIVGGLLLNATRNLFLEGPHASKLPLIFTFAHDTDILQVLATMGVDAPEDPTSWDPTQTRFNQRYNLADLVPQGARLVFERMSCSGNANAPSYINEHPLAFDDGSTKNYSPSNQSDSEIYVRVILNEAVVPIDGLTSGPGRSTPLNDFDTWVSNMTLGKEYAKMCALENNQPDELTFFRNYSLSNQYNADSDILGAQATFLDLQGNPEK